MAKLVTNKKIVEESIKKKVKGMVEEKGSKLREVSAVRFPPLFSSFVLYKCHTPNYRHMIGVGSHYRMASYKLDS